jgi:hypothetical protein
MAPAAAVPGAASASPVRRVIPPAEEACPIRHVMVNVTYSCAEEFTVNGTAGYEVKVSASPGSRHVEVTAEGSEGEVEYIAPAKITAETIRARIPDVGRIEVRFRPSARERRVKVPKQCLKERPPVVSARLGRFVGTIELHGERGYTKVDAHNVAGAIGDPLANIPRKLECESHESKAQTRRELGSIEFDGEPAGEGISLSAFRLFPGFPLLSPPLERSVRKGDHYVFFVVAGENRGGVTTVRSTSALGGSGSFSFDESLASATIAPPAPFTGTGTFVRNADGSIGWTGSLAVRLPGLGMVPLTGGKAELATVAAQRQKLDEEFEEQLKPASGPAG